MDTTNQFITRANSLYKVLYYANALGIEKSILDCGAGGRNPPLYLFYIYGFKCSGIDIAKDSICKAKEFEKTYNCSTIADCRKSRSSVVTCAYGIVGSPDSLLLWKTTFYQKPRCLYTAYIFRTSDLNSRNKNRY